MNLEGEEGTGHTEEEATLSPAKAAADGGMESKCLVALMAQTTEEAGGGLVENTPCVAGPSGSMES